jgi:hypothetical protein
MQSGKYRFFGTECMLGDTRFDMLGQYAEFDEVLAHEVTHGGGQFLHEEDFDAIFSAKDCTTYPSANGWPEPTPEFAAKRQRAARVYASYISPNEYPQGHVSE